VTTDERVPRPREDLLLGGVADKALVLDRAGGRAHVLNSSAAWIWNLLDGERSVDDVVAVVVSASGLEPVRIRADVTATVERFVAAGLLGAAPEGPDARSPTTGPDVGSRRPPATGTEPVARHRLGPYRAIGLVATVAVDDPAIAAALASLLAGLVDQREPQVRYVVTDHDDPRHRAHLDGALIGAADDPDAIVAAVLVDLNRRAIEQATGRLLFHAGAVDLGGVAVALPAASGSGKSTLTAALVAGGAGYLSDEAAVIHPDTFVVEPYRKPIALAAASVDAVARSTGAPRAGRPRIGDVGPAPSKAHLAPSAFGPSSSGAPLAALVFPQYVPGATTELLPLGVEDALVALVPCTFAATWSLTDALDRVVALVESVPAHRLTFSDLDSATSCIRGSIRTGDPR
jgi:hypothetical protein